jgi:hypothetical protein
MKTMHTMFFVMAIAIMVVIPTTIVFGQAAASVTWTLFADQTYTTIGNVTGSNQTSAGLDPRSYSQAVTGGPNATSQRWWPTAGASWGPETAPVASRYIQFVASPATGSSFTVDSITIYIGSGGTNMVKALLQYSTDASFSNPTKMGDTVSFTTKDVLSYVSTAIGVTLTSGQSIYFRVLPWYTGAASASKYFLTQYAVIKGTTLGGTGVQLAGNGIPNKFELNQNFPNPFNPSTMISYGIPKESDVTIKVFNVLGQEVATLFAGHQVAGTHSVTFDASKLSSGVYLYRVEAGNSVAVKKMVLMK